MGSREKGVESYLNQRVKAQGGITRKWVSPGHIGVPDRIVFLKGQVWFVEVKTEGGILSIGQQREIERLTGQKVNVFVVYGYNDVDAFMESFSE